MNEQRVKEEFLKLADVMGWKVVIDGHTNAPDLLGAYGLEVIAGNKRKVYRVYRVVNSSWKVEHTPFGPSLWLGSSVAVECLKASRAAVEHYRDNLLLHLRGYLDRDGVHVKGGE